MKMRKILMAGITAVALSGVAFVATTPAKAASDDLNVAAEIVAAISLDCTTQDLDFGLISAPSNGNSSIVTVSPVGGRTIGGTGDGALIGGATGDQGECTATGTDTYTAVVTIPASTLLSGPGADMTVNNFQIDTPGGTDGASPQTFTLDGTGQVIAIGADLTVADGQVAGTYTGTIAIDVSYQ